jgi:hypothetical protein
VNARKDDGVAFVQSVPDDVGKPPDERTTVSAVPLGKRQRIVTDTPEETIDRVPELGPKTRLLVLVPILDSH